MSIKRLVPVGLTLGAILFAVYSSLRPVKLPYELTPEYPLGETAKVEQYLGEKLGLSGPGNTISSLTLAKAFAKIGKVHEFKANVDGLKTHKPQCVDLILDRKGNIVALGGAHSVGGSSSVKIVLDSYLAIRKKGAFPSGNRELVVSEWWEGSQRYVTLVIH